MANYKKAKKEIVTLSPPNVIDMLMAILYKAKAKPQEFPVDPTSAARFWLAHQEPANDHSEAVTPITDNGEVVGWKTPYHDRVCANLKKFLLQKNIHRMFILKHIEAGIPWRGDSLKMYAEIVRETEIMMRDKQAYIQGAFTKLKQFRFAA